MGLFKKRADPAEAELLRAELAAMSARLDAADEAKQQLGVRLQQLATQIDEQRQEPAPTAPEPSVSERDIDMLRAQFQRLSDRVDETANGAADGTGSAELDDVRKRLDIVTHRLEEALAADDDVGGGGGSIDAAELGEVRSRLDLLTHRLEEALADDDDGSAHTIDATDVHELRQRVEALDAIVGMSLAADGGGGGSIDPVAFEQLQARVDELGARFDTPLATPPPPTPPPNDPVPIPVIDDTALSDINDRLDTLAARLDDVDVRITSISTELANQITEISGELDALGANEPTADHVVDELRDAQTRLANEQARYQIAFRQDLADLAQRLKRS